VHCPTRHVAVFPPAHTGGSGPSLVGILRPFGVCAEVAPSAATDWRRPWEVRAAKPSPVPPSGFLSPSAVSAATPRLTRVSPDPLETPRDPQLCGLVSCRKRPWDSPFRAFPSRGAVPPSGGLVLPCGFGRDFELRREGARFVAIAFRRAPISSRATGPRRAPRRDSRIGNAASCGRSRPACPPRESPRASTSTSRLRLPVLRASHPARRPRQPTCTLGLAGSQPCRPLRSFAPPESPFTRCSPAHSSFRPSSWVPTGPLLSWDSPF